MKIRNKVVASALASTMMGLAACGGGGSGTQDVGNKSPQSTSRAFYARAIDGYLAGATVYVDQNGNNKLDAFEPRALTDSDGYFSYNHKTDTDYCATDGLSQYCLRGNIAANEEVIIRVTGGYDTVTQLPFKGVLSLRSSELGKDDLRIVTPATSMVVDTPEAQAKAKIDALIAAGVLDPGGLNKDLSDQAEITRAQVAALISQIVNEAGKETYPATFQDVEGAAWAQSYIAMASKTIEGITEHPSATFGSIFATPADLAEIARTSIYAAMNSGQVAPSSFELPNVSQLQSLFEGGAAIVGLNEQLIAALNGAAPTPEELKAILRVQAIAAERIVANPNDPELQDLGDWVHNQLQQGNGLGSDLTALGGDNIDVGALTASSFDFDPASNSISASVTIPDGVATAFAALANTSFGVEVNEPDERGAALFFVSGDSGARSGKIDVCVRYSGDDEDFDTTSSTDPNGAMRIGGHWNLLNDHSLTLSIDVAGGVRSLLLNAVSSGGIQDLSNYRFDFGGGDLSEWSGSAPAAFAAGAVPASDAACKDALIEKFGSMVD